MSEIKSFRFLGRLPTHVGRCVGICTFRDVVLVACEFGVVKMRYSDVLDELRVSRVEIFEVKPQ